MTSVLLRRVAALTVLVITTAAIAAAQPDGWVALEFKHHPEERLAGCYPEKGVYDAEKLRQVMSRPNCARLNELGLDPDRQSVVYYHVGSDCHMKLSIRVFRSDAERKFHVVINNIYGGCRAGGWRSGWLTFEKPPIRYDIAVRDVRVDRMHEANIPEGFVYPKSR